MNFTVYYKEIEILVNFDNSYLGHSFELMENGMKKVYSVTDTIPSSSAKKITVNYTIDTINPANNVVESTIPMKKRVGADRYDAWYAFNLSEYTGTYGHLTFAPSLNTVMEVLFGDKNACAFNEMENYNPFQPIFFTVDAISTSADVNVTRAEGKTVQYSIFKGSWGESKDYSSLIWQESNSFSDLNADTLYTFFAKTIEDQRPCVYEAKTVGS